MITNNYKKIAKYTKDKAYKPTIYETIANATKTAVSEIKTLTKQDIESLRIHMDKQVYKRDEQQ
jgi:hypothetical protein